MSLACIDLDENGLSTAGAFQYGTANLLSISKWTTVNVPGKCCNSAPWKFGHLEQAQNKHLLTFSRQHFFFLFFHFKVTNEEAEMQRTLCRNVEQILPVSHFTTCEMCVFPPLLGLHFSSTTGLCHTEQLSDGGSQRRREAMELCSSSAADVSS